VKSLWNDQEASAFSSDLAQCVYASRLLGQEKTLVLHGGGNTSVKSRERNIFGEEEDILYVKGSGWDLAKIEAAGFAPVRLAHLLRLTTLDSLTDKQWANELNRSVTDLAAPPVSVEAMLHALLPEKYVFHTHSDALLTLTNTPQGAERVQELYGKAVILVPYTRPGFPLAKCAAQLFRTAMQEKTIGVVLMRHGLFTFGETAKIAYERMIALVSQAENYLEEHGAWQITISPLLLTAALSAKPLRQEIATFRQAISKVAGFPVILTTHDDAEASSFVHHVDVATLSQQGPVTPDHVIRTKRVPLLGKDVESYKIAYETYFKEHSKRTELSLTMLDPAPRVILDAELGLLTVGRNAQEANIVHDMYRHTMAIILRATALEKYQAQPITDVFDVEYWELEQAKLHLKQNLPMFAGEIALVTGAASGIGKACVESFLARGAAVVGLDINPAIEKLFDRPDFLGIRCNLTSESEIYQALDKTAKTFGGIDMLVLNAGIFPSAKRIDSLSLDEWRKIMNINLDSNLIVMREVYPFLKAAPKRGRVSIIGSKNVPAPGPGAAAYSASKAALNQLARVAALEWGKDGIRLNILHPNAVFDTGLWTEELLQARAAHYGLTVEAYKTNNVMQIEVTSRDVAELAAEMCGPLFAKTTAAQVPIDGGNERVI